MNGIFPVAEKSEIPVGDSAPAISFAARDFLRNLGELVQSKKKYTARRTKKVPMTVLRELPNKIW